ncbi:MAG: thioredoxin domain-containing protein, partial [Micrococcales bacterium]|nr:thioredoxin domain-containing protein [Micrococcales bacterium]
PPASLQEPVPSLTPPELVRRQPGQNVAGLVIVGTIAVIALVVGLIALILALSRGASEPEEALPTPEVTVTETVQAEGEPQQQQEEEAMGAEALAVPGIAIGADGVALPGVDAGPAVRLDLYSDYMCPYCGRFEMEFGATIQGLIDSGDVAFVLHPVSILDAYSQGTNYSTRASRAAMSVAVGAPEAFGAFNEALFAQQPEENTKGLDDEAIAEIAKQAGVPNVIAENLLGVTSAEEISSLTSAASRAGLRGTPTLLFTAGGETVQWDYQASINDMVTRMANTLH